MTACRLFGQIVRIALLSRCGDYSGFGYSWRAEFDDSANVISAFPAYS